MRVTRGSDLPVALQFLGSVQFFFAITSRLAPFRGRGTISQGCDYSVSVPHPTRTNEGMLPTVAFKCFLPHSKTQV